MSEHLPECEVQFLGSEVCICPELRACEQRIKAAAYESATPQVRQDEIRHIYNVGFSAGLHAARDAVEAYLQDGTCVDCSHTSRDAEILDAIDRLTANADTERNVSDDRH